MIGKSLKLIYWKYYLQEVVFHIDEQLILILQKSIMDFILKIFCIIQNLLFQYFEKDQQFHRDLNNVLTVENI
jgi:hypothetical protein